MRLGAELILLRAVTVMAGKEAFWQFQAEVGSAAARTKAEAKARMVSLEQALDVWERNLRDGLGHARWPRAWRLIRSI